MKRSFSREESNETSFTTLVQAVKKLVSGRRHRNRRVAGLVFTNNSPQPLFSRRAFYTSRQLF